MSEGEVSHLGGSPDLVNRKFEAESSNRLYAVNITYVHGGADGLVHHSHHDAVVHQHAVHHPRVMEYGMLLSTGMVGDFYANAMSESVNGTYKTELVWRRKPSN